MRFAYPWLIVAVAACSGNGPVKDGVYTGTITASGCMSGQTFQINMVNGKPSFSSSVMCSTNEVTGDGFDFDCSTGGGETHYYCISQGTVLDSHRVVHATFVGTNKLSGTIEVTDTDYSPPNCVVTSQCSDSGTFELALESSL